MMRAAVERAHTDLEKYNARVEVWREWNLSSRVERAEMLRMHPRKRAWDEVRYDSRAPVRDQRRVQRRTLPRLADVMIALVYFGDDASTRFVAALRLCGCGMVSFRSDVYGCPWL